jgi:uncharacterized membrane protein
MEPAGLPPHDDSSSQHGIPPWFPQNLPAPVQEALNDPNLRGQILSFSAAFSAANWSGPYPPPDLLRGYEDVLPGSANRIISMAERQQDHRHELEKTTVVGASKRAWWGLWLGFAISVIVLVLGTVTILLGYPWAGGTVMGVDVVALAGVFVVGQRQQSKERIEKNAQSQEPSSPPGPPAKRA